MEISLVAARDLKSQISNARSSTAPSPPSAPTCVLDIGYRIQDSSRVEVYVTADGVLRYSTSMSRNPYRLSVSLLNAVLSKDFPGIQVRHSLLQRVSATRTGCDVILTMELTRVASYKIRQEGASAKLVVSIDLPKGADGQLAGKTVVIDPGHGGSDGKPPGCFGLLEKNCTLDIAKRVQKVLAKAGLKVVMTREADVNVDLAERALIAKRCSADFFISIHCNAAGTQTGTANGTETYYHGGDPSGQALAECIHPEVVKAMGLRDRSVKPDTTIWQTGFGVLRMTSAYGIPAILIEVGFLDNPFDAERIADPGVQEEVARAILNGLKAYVAGDFTVPINSQV
ncbi:MAG: N-acetylmuramoyl-L-alanine amidase, partial [Armatimonadetes bacterium]|nr:N-acetylmuramoyl-L-alanine amidase [Armatimonadota bacterium]